MASGFFQGRPMRAIASLAKPLAGGAVRALRLRWAKYLAAALILVAAAAQAQTPFQPVASTKPKLVRLLAYPEYFDRRVFEAFEKQTGYAVGYDSYALQVEIPDKWKDGPYDVVVLPGATLAKRIAAGNLMKLDKARLTRARDVQAGVLAKLAAYDPTGAYAVAFGWSPFGLIYDAQKVPPRLGDALTSWVAMFDPRYPRELGGCGAVIPNARDAVFVAVWKMMGLEPWKVGPTQLKFASAVLARVKPALKGFAVADPVGALARGAACLTLGTPGEAAAANKRAKLTGRPESFAFAYAREGGGVAIDAFAIPRDAPNPDVAYRLIDFLLRAENMDADARLAGVVSAEDGRDVDVLKKLTPLGGWTDPFTNAVEAEWTHLRVAK
jgi:spermidine/putrescine-binding protein